MRLSIIFELLLIFLLIAFAAYARVIESNGRAALKKLNSATLVSNAPISLKQATENVNKYCVCNENICNCCRDFHIPLVQLSGPGCASLQYLQENKLAMQLSIGDNILSSNIVNGNNPKPVCVNLPGGFSKFCGKIYSIKKEADKHFKACLGLELRSASELEASLRVSCFRFGPDGLKLRPAEPLPPTISIPSSSNTDDDYGDLFSLDDDDEDDDDDDDDEENDDTKVSAQTSSSSLTASAAAAAAEQEQNQGQAVEEEEDDDDDDDLLGLSALLDIFTGDDDSTTNKKTKPTVTTALPSFTIPILALTTTSNPLTEPHSNVNPTTTVLNKGPTTTLRPHSTTTSVSNDHDSLPISTEKMVETTSDATVSNDENDADVMKISHEDETTMTTSVGITESTNISLDTEKVINSKKSKINSTETKQSDKKKIGNAAKPNTTKIHKLGTKQQVVTSSTVADDSSESIYEDENDENDDDDDAEDEDDTVSDENNSDEKQIESANESDKTANAEDAGTTANDYDQSYDDSDEDEDEDTDVEVMSTLLDDDVSTEKTDRRKNKVKTNKANSKKESAPTRTADYDYELTEILGRKYSNRANAKGVKRKNTLKNRQNEK